jgi:hypothetical protein
MKKNFLILDNMKRLIIAFFLCCLCWMAADAQRIKFKNIRNHMIADVILDGNIKAKALIDTGGSMTLIDSAFAAKNGIEVNRQGERMRMRFPLGTVYCYPLQKDTLDVNGLHNSRPVYVGNVKEFHKKNNSVDVDMIMGTGYVAQDGSRMLTLNIDKGYVEYGRKEIGKEYRKGILTVDEHGFVGTDAPLRLYPLYGKSGQIRGRFVFDTGNANYFFLCGKNKAVTQFINEKGIELEEKVMGKKTLYYFRMNSAEILGKEIDMKGQAMVVLPKVRFYDYAGAIGYKFLSEVELILDYDNNLLYIK